MTEDMNRFAYEAGLKIGSLQAQLDMLKSEGKHQMYGKKVELLVRETPCEDHPNEEWITLKIDGFEVLSMCMGLFKVITKESRGKDILSWGS